MRGGDYAWYRLDASGAFSLECESPSNVTFDTVASMRSFNYEYAYIITLIVNELIEDNSVKESIVH